MEYNKRHRTTFDWDGAMQLVSSGMTMSDVGAKYGVSRERIRQIAKLKGVMPQTSWRSVHQRQAECEALIEGGMSIEEAKAKSGCSIYYARKVAVALGVGKKVKNLEARLAQLRPLVERVRNGESIRSVCGGSNSMANMIMYYAKQLGSLGISRHGRWRDFSTRETIIRAGLEAGKTWTAIATEVSTAEAYPVTANSIRLWAYTRELYQWRKLGPKKPKAERKPRETRPERIHKTDPNKITLAYGAGFPTMKRARVKFQDPDLIQAICAAKGMKSASVLGHEFGLSRNAVIGIWGRHAKAMREEVARQQDERQTFSPILASEA